MCIIITKLALIISRSINPNFDWPLNVWEEGKKLARQAGQETYEEEGGMEFKVVVGAGIKTSGDGLGVTDCTADIGLAYHRTMQYYETHKKTINLLILFELSSENH